MTTTHELASMKPVYAITRDTTPLSERTSEFYRDAFTSLSTWGPGIFEIKCADHSADHSIVPADDEFFCHTADRLWNAMTDEERSQFAADYDDWLDD